MKAIAINGSPRKDWNTHLLLAKALEGAASHDWETEMVHLYDLDYKGCTGCLACKLKGSKHLGKCIIKDDLQAVLRRIDECDALFLGSPIYFGEVTGEMRSFLERLLFQGLSYDKQGTTLYPRNTPILALYTMNMPRTALSQLGYDAKFRSYEQLFARFFGPSRTVLATQSLQTHDYGKHHMAMFDAPALAQRREDVFPLVGEKARLYAAAIAAGNIDALPDDLAQEADGDCTGLNIS